MKRLALIVLVVFCFCPVIACTQGAMYGVGGLLQGFTQGLAMARGYAPPPVYYPPPVTTYQPPVVAPPISTFGSINHPNGQVDLFSVMQTPLVGPVTGTIYGANGGVTTFQGTRY